MKPSLDRKTSSLKEKMEQTLVDLHIYSYLKVMRARCMWWIQEAVGKSDLIEMMEQMWGMGRC